MESTATIVQLTANNDTASKVLDVLGHKITVTTEVWGENDIDTYYEFSHRGSSDAIGVDGDDSLGICIGLYNKDDGILFGLFDFGSRGHLALVINDEDKFYRIGDL